MRSINVVTSMEFPSYSKWRKPDRAGRVLDRHGEADADEDALLGRVEQARDDADHLAVERDERPARIARIHRRVELDEVGEDLLALRLVFALQARDHAGGGRGADAEREADGDDFIARAQAIG